MSEENEVTKKKKKTIELPTKVLVPFTWAHEKGATVREAEITFDLSELTSEDVLNYMLDSLVIKKQGSLRRLFGTEKWTAPKTRTEGEGEKARLIEVYEEKAAKPGERKSADPTKKLAKELAETMTTSGLTLEAIKELVEKAKLAEIAKGYETGETGEGQENQG